ncbi:MAG: hypothetical protein Q9170_008215 [Blastenia crenularia]
MYSAGVKSRTRLSDIRPGSKPQNKGEQEKNIWSSLLNGVASGKKLPEKNLLVLDILARLSIYLLSESSPSFSSLVKPLLTSERIPETLVVILLDWADPWSWARQVRDWIRFLKGVVGTWDDDCKIAAEGTMKEWQQRRRGAPYEGGSAALNDTSIKIPLGQGEWRLPNLHVPLSPQLPPHTHPLLPRHPLPPKAANPKTQRH